LVAAFSFAGDLAARFIPLLAPAPASANVFAPDGPRSVPTLRHERCADVYRRLGDRPARARHVSLAYDRQGTTGLYAQLIVLSCSGAIRFGPDPIVSIPRSEPIPDRPVTHADRPGFSAAFYIQVEFNPARGPILYTGADSAGQLEENERFVAFHLLDDYLRRAGVLEYVLIPYLQYRDEPKPLPAPAPSRPHP
jgi:hypothetical protein